MADKIKVLHIIKTLGLGGAEVNLLNLVKATDHQRFELHVAYSAGGELEEKFKREGVKLFKFAGQNHKVKSLASIGIIARLVHYLRTNRIDVVHTHIFSAHLWGAAAAKLAGCKIIEHVHDFRYFEPQDFVRRRGMNNQYRFVYQFKNISDKVVVLTKQNQDFILQEKLYPVERVYEYQNGIPLNGSAAKLIEDAKKNEKQVLISKYGLRPDALIILTPIRIAPEKNVDLILRIAPEVIRQVPQAVFLIAGDGPLFEQCSGQIKEMGLADNIKMIGYHSDIHALLQGTDVFLLPSFLELHSIAILEAMSVKVPVVVSEDVGCNSEVFDDWQNGVLLDPFKDEGWAQALIKLLQDPQLRRQMGEKGYETCHEKFNISGVAQKFESLYKELISC
jgi:glycosyltransferase involved in cell wall biosynthesis